MGPFLFIYIAVGHGYLVASHLYLFHHGRSWWLVVPSPRSLLPLACHFSSGVRRFGVTMIYTGRHSAFLMLGLSCFAGFVLLLILGRYFAYYLLQPCPRPLTSTSLCPISLSRYSSLTPSGTVHEAPFRFPRLPVLNG